MPTGYCQSFFRLLKSNFEKFAESLKLALALNLGPLEMLVRESDVLTRERAHLFKTMTLEEENELLIQIVKELVFINDYELPYRIPPLRERAEKLLTRLDFEGTKSREFELA